MFRIADGHALPAGDPQLRGHSIEFRINAEDPGRNFLPAPGTISAWQPPSGPGVRLDAGYAAGMTVPQAFDSLIAKLIVTGATRDQALERSRRALAEFQIDGMPTVLPFHRAVVDDPAFTLAPFKVHTRWIETEFAGDLPPYSGVVGSSDDDEAGGAGGARERITVEVGGKRLEVVIPAGLGVQGAYGADAGRAGAGRGGPGSAVAGRSPAGHARRRGSGGRGGRGGSDGATADGDALISPMQGTIVKIVAAEGQHVSAGETVVVLEAMKMEQPLTAHKDGTVTALAVQVGQTVSAGEVICQLKD
jgi:acetyl-CoA/propionyl-CoA carboxylase, biotin carboxylase, biotin carboxyl carrier protein